MNQRQARARSERAKRQANNFPMLGYDKDVHTWPDDGPMQDEPPIDYRHEVAVIIEDAIHETLSEACLLGDMCDIEPIIKAATDDIADLFDLPPLSPSS